MKGIAVGAVCACVLALACSSSSNGGGGSSSCAESAAGQQGGASSACTSCAESNCGSQISAYESGCSDYLSCVCPGGSYNGSLAQQCVSKAQESSCTSAAESVGSCVSQHCASACGTGSGSSSGGSSGSSSGGGSSSGSGGSGSSSGGGGGTIWCSFSGVVCENGVTASACAKTNGMVVSSCPTANLQGCCKTAANEACYYTGVANAQQNCMQSGGTWQTMP